jgi:hypothetical protein
MRACLRGLGLFAVVLVAVPLLAADEPGKKPADPKPGAKAGPDSADAQKPDATKPDKKTAKKATKKKAKAKDEVADKGEKKEKLVWGAYFSGKLKEMDSQAPKKFTVEVQIRVPNPDGIAAKAKADFDYAQRRGQILLNGGLNVVQKQQQLAQAAVDYNNQLPNLLQNMWKYVPRDVPCKATDDVRVRTWSPPLEYDDKGHVKKYTRKSLERLKGPEKYLPGYTAEYEALRAGQYVTVYLAKSQPNPVPTARGSKGAKSKAAPAPIKITNPDDAAVREHRYEVVMAVIMAEPKDR